MDGLILVILFVHFNKNLINIYNIYLLYLCLLPPCRDGIRIKPVLRIWIQQDFTQLCRIWTHIIVWSWIQLRNECGPGTLDITIYRFLWRSVAKFAHLKARLIFSIKILRRRRTKESGQMQSFVVLRTSSYSSPTWSALEST